jgi:hypothetical protein
MERQLSLPGLEARLENDQLVVETAAEDIHCGRALAIARTWQIWALQAGKHEQSLGKEDKERADRRSDRAAPMPQVRGC